MVPNYRTSPTPVAVKKKKSGGGGKMVLKIFGTVGAVGFGCVLLLRVGIFAFGMLGALHSGWQTETFHGYTIDMPPGKDRKTDTQQFPQTTVHELAAQRKETGSQYSLVVAKIPPGIDVNIEQLVKMMQIRISNQRPVARGGVNGLAGKLDAGVGGVIGSESEIFSHSGNLVLVTYAPYSQIKDLVGGKRKPRSNERKLDKPDDFFASIKFP